ncbi:MAG: ankyrin repeat domain-containing protein [Alphaproteobacteria bacterium]
MTDSTQADKDWEAKGMVTDLLYFAMKGDVKEVESLIAKGVDINGTENYTPETALYYAASSGDARMVALLLSHGAETTMNHPTTTPRIIALAKNFDNVAKQIDNEEKRRREAKAAEEKQRRIDDALSCVEGGTTTPIKVASPLKLGRKAGA